MSKVTSDAKDASIVLIQPRLSESTSEDEAPTEEARTRSPPVETQQEVHTVDLKPYTPTGFRLEDVPLEDDTKLKVTICRRVSLFGLRLTHS